jgi:hypothetical protein
MSGFDYVSVALVAYRIITVLSGVALAWMGYQLFLSGVFGNAGDMDARWGQNRLLLKRATPGTFFAVLGTAIVVTSVLKGASTEHGTRGFSMEAPSPGRLKSTTPSADSSKTMKSLQRDIVPILQKMLSGKTLTPKEREFLRNWYEEWDKTTAGSPDSLPSHVS